MKVFNIILIIIISIALSSCTRFYIPRENIKKIDSKANKVDFIYAAPDMNSVELQKNQTIPKNFRLNGGIGEFKKLDIIKDININGDKIEIDFLAKKLNEKSNGKDNYISEELLWENALFLIYTVIDTFKDLEVIHLESHYYYKDQYGNPYNEIIFIINTKAHIVKKINRNYFKPEMLKNIVDYYIADDIIKEEKKELR